MGEIQTSYAAQFTTRQRHRLCLNAGRRILKHPATYRWKPAEAGSNNAGSFRSIYLSAFRAIRFL